MDETGKKKLWEEYANTGSPEVREKIILEYAPLVKVVAGRLSMYLGYNVEYEDLGTDLAKNHGVIQEIDGRPVMPIYHPNYLLLKPAAKRDAWNALQVVQNLLKNA